MNQDQIVISGLQCRTIIGLHSWERLTRQDVFVDAWLACDLRAAGRTDRIEDSVNYGVLASIIVTYVEESTHLTVEALAAGIAGICVMDPRITRARIRVQKPRAHEYSRMMGIEIERQASDLVRTAFIGLGSNHQAQAKLQQGMRALQRVGTFVAASSVYESPAIGQAGQPDYFNAVCAVSTPLPAEEIRRRLKEIERLAGREKGQQPVPLDLDLCLLGNESFASSVMKVPHPELTERYYLAAGIAEIDPQLSHPETGESFGSIAARLKSSMQFTVHPKIDLAQ